MMKAPAPGASEKEEKQLETKDATWREEEEEEGKNQLVKKKMIIVSSLMCGSLAFILWGIFKFPKKFESTRVFQNQTCLEHEQRCPHGWIQISHNCFFPSEHESPWIDSQENCNLYSATLANFSSQNEMESMMGHLTSSSYWIGLNRLNANRTWKWSGGCLYQNWFNIEENGDCAFMHKTGLNSSSCDDMRKYLCSKTTVCL